jgi:guanylate kinase
LSERGRLIVFAAPAGGGKTTVIRKLLAAHPDWIFSVSATTRLPRAGEVNGREYHFLSDTEFRERIETGDFLEYEDVHGNLYGTLRSETEKHLQSGDTVVFDLDVKGAKSIKAAYPHALTIFLKPPSLDVLRKRLEARGTESAETIERRLSRAKMEMEYGEEFDAVIVNDKLDDTVASVERAIEKTNQKSKIKK